MTIPVCDLHCDLLSFLVMKENRDSHFEQSRCSFPQLQGGGVHLQTLAIYCPTETHSTELGLRQLNAYKTLPQAFIPLKESRFPLNCEKNALYVLPSLENASTFAEESEPLSRALSRFEYFCQEAGPFLYVSLTWNTENRFGGGNATQIGLKKDGEALLEHLEGRGIAIDFSHTSDALACDILNHIEKKGLKLPVMASHSNFRSVTSHPRNLPDEIAKEIAKRNGIIGINLFRAFVGEQFEDSLVKIVSHAHKLDIHNALCFGADFFCDLDFVTTLKYPPPFFHDNYANARCYPKIQTLLERPFSKETVENICHKNFIRFYENRL